MEIAIGTPTESGISLAYMEDWARRIKERIDADPALTMPGLARACGAKQPSIFQWFNDTDYKPATKMLTADNLIRAARYIGMDPTEIMTGHSSASQSARPDPVKLANLIETVDAGVAGTKLARDAKTKARLVVALYMDAKVETASRETVSALLSGILASMEALK